MRHQRLPFTPTLSLLLLSSFPGEIEKQQQQQQWRWRGDGKRVQRRRERECEETRKLTRETYLSLVGDLRDRRL